MGGRNEKKKSLEIGTKNTSGAKKREDKEQPSCIFPIHNAAERESIEERTSN